MTAKQLKAIRQRLQLTQRELAAKLRVARNTIARWEMGAVPISGPAALLLKRLDEEGKANGEN